MDLTVDESAMLVGLLPSPASYSPIHHPKKAIRRRNTVLRLLRDQKFIQVPEFHEYRSKTLESVQEWTSRGTAPYFTEYVRRLLEKIDEELGINIYRDGLKIYTTVDSRLQKIAERAVLETIQEDQVRLNRRLFNNREEFENLAYLTIYPEDTLKAKMAGEG